MVIEMLIAIKKPLYPDSYRDGGGFKTECPRFNGGIEAFFVQW